jgi:signal transduction histidine kinase
VTTAASTRPDRWGIQLGRVGGMLGYVWIAIASAPPGRVWLVAALALVSVVGAVYGWRWAAQEWRRRLVGVAVLAAGGIALFAVDARSPGWLAGYFAIASGLARLPLRIGGPLAVAVTAALGGIALLYGEPVRALSVVAGCAGFAILGMTLGGARDRAAAAERLLASERAAMEATAQSRVYAERQRLAREIHDILAHTLSAQIVHLEGARLLLARDAPADAVRAQIEQAQRLAREGLEETRRAVHSLRGDARPLPDALRALADTAGATLAVRGEPRPVEPETALALERTVQEALTNARKHAPGGTVTATLTYRADGYEVEVCDTGAADGSAPLTSTGSGYGLAGMRERAELIGGELAAEAYPVGTDGRGYRVWLKIPN